VIEAQTCLVRISTVVGVVTAVQSAILTEMSQEPMELVYRCLSCGHLVPKGRDLPERCPDCGGPKEDFVLVEED
jgi:rubrerythrin